MTSPLDPYKASLDKLRFDDESKARMVSALEAAAGELIETVSRILWRGQRVASGCSIGGCRIGPSGASYERLYGEADRALYQAKARGKGQFSLVRLP